MYSASLSMRTKKMVVAINQANAQRVGITNQDIAVSLRTVLSGIQTGEFREGDKVIPVIMRDAQQDNLHFGAMEGLNIFSQSTLAVVFSQQHLHNQKMDI